MVPLRQVRPLLDTNVLVHLIRSDELAYRIEREHSLSQMPTPLMSVVIAGEIRALALRFGWGSRRLERMQLLLDAFTIVPLEYPGLIDAYAVLEHEGDRFGHSMGKNDGWIAATAYAAGAELLTTDMDFDHLHPRWITRTRVNPRS